MAQDLRELFKREREGDGPSLKPGHRQRFRKHLEKAFPQMEEASRQGNARSRQDDGAPQQENALPQRKKSMPQREKSLQNRPDGFGLGYGASASSGNAIPQQDKTLPQPGETFPESGKAFVRQLITPSLLLKIAASVMVLIGIATYYLTEGKDEIPVKTTIVDTKGDRPGAGTAGKGSSSSAKEALTLGDLSPNLKKVENYYVANINFELSKLEVSQENKMLVDGFMDQLAKLDQEYRKLNAELNRIGPNDQTVNALIKNLQLRLQLLHRMKEKLNLLKSSKNESVTTNKV